MKRKTKLEADRVLAHHVYKGAMHKDLTEQAELRSEWEPIRDDIKHVVDLVLLMQDIIGAPAQGPASLSSESKGARVRGK